MYKARIAIVSKRERVIEFFSLEAKNFFFTVDISDRFRADFCAHDLCVIDAVSIKQLPSRLPLHVILVDADDSLALPKHSDSKFFLVSFPFSLSRLSDIYAAIAFREQTSRDSVQEGINSVIYVCETTDGTFKICYEQKYIQLSESEMILLERLCRNAGEAVSRKELNELLGASRGNIVDVYICKLRKKLEQVDAKRVIRTVRSYGYECIIGMKWE